MVKIVTNGKDKIFYTKCHKCSTEFEYQFEDVKTEKIKSLFGDSESDMEAVRCPVCNEPISATLLTKKEYDNMFPSGCGPYMGYA